MPSPIGGASIAHRSLDLFFHSILRQILGSKNDLPALAFGFFSGPPKKSFRAFAPKSDRVLRIEEKHGVIFRSFDQKTETFLRSTQTFLNTHAFNGKGELAGDRTAEIRIALAELMRVIVIDHELSDQAIGATQRNEAAGADTFSEDLLA